MKFINQGFIQPFHQIMVGVGKAQKRIIDVINLNEGKTVTPQTKVALEKYSKFLEDRYGYKEINVLTELSKLLERSIEESEKRGIPKGQGFVNELARAVYEGGGRLAVDLPIISQLGLVTYTTTMGAGEAKLRGEDPVRGAVKGFAEGVLLKGSLKGLSVLPMPQAMAGGAAVFGIPSAVSEMQLPPEQREYGRVAGDAMLGAGLMALGQKPTQEQFRAMRIAAKKPPEVPEKPIEPLKPEILPEVPVEPVTPTEARKRLTVEGERMEIQETAKNRLREISDKHPKQTISHDASDAMSFLVKEPEIKTFVEKYGEGKTTAILTKGVQILTDKAAQTDALIRKMDVSALSSKDIIRFREQLSESLEATLEPVKIMSSEAGRALESLKKYTVPNIKALKKIGEIPPENRAEWERAIELYKRIDPSNPREFADFLMKIENPNFREYMWEYWYNSILSGLPTHLVNTVSNSTWQAFQTPYRGIRSVVDIPVAKLQGRQREYYLSEIVPMWVGYKQGLKTAVPKVLRLIRTGELEADMTKWGIEIGKSMEAFARSPSPVLRKIAPVVSFPSRVLRGADVFFRCIAYDGEIHATAMRTAIKEGLKGESRSIRYAELVKNPTDAMMKAGGKFSDYSTYMDAPGKLTAAIMNVRNRIPGGRFLMAFVRTPLNLLKRGAELTPGLGVVVQRKQLRGPELSGVITNQIMGGLITAYFATKYIDGELTGSAPRKEAERLAFYRQGKLPWSIQVGSHWISYRRIEPFSLPIAAVAIAGDAWRDYGKVPNTELVVKTGMEFGRYLLDVSYMSQLSDFVENINRGDSGYKSMRRFGQRFPTSFVPYSSFQRSMARATEAVETGKVVLREPRTVIEATKAQIPFLTETVAARKTIFGQEILLPGGPIRQWLPYKASKATNDPVELELQRLGIHPGMPARKIRGIELTDEEYDRYLTLSGEAIYKELKRIVTSKTWVEAKDNLQTRIAQDKIIERVFDRIREAVRGKILIEMAEAKMPAGIE